MKGLYGCHTHSSQLKPRQSQPLTPIQGAKTKPNFTRPETMPAEDKLSNLNGQCCLAVTQIYLIAMFILSLEIRALEVLLC